MAPTRLRGLVPRRPAVRILLLLVVAAVAIGIAGALFSGEETAASDPAASDPAAPETAASPSGAAPAAVPSPDGTPDAGSVVEEDSAAEHGAPSPPGVDSEDASAGDALLPTTADDIAASTPPDDTEAPATTDDAAVPTTADDTAAQTAADDTSTASTVTTTPAAPGAEGSAAVETASPTNAAVDEPAASEAAAQLIEQLRPLVAERDSNIPDYDRDHFASWLDADRDCVNTRHEILQAEAADFSMNAEGCAVDSGECSIPTPTGRSPTRAIWTWITSWRWPTPGCPARGNGPTNCSTVSATTSAT